MDLKKVLDGEILVSIMRRSPVKDEPVFAKSLLTDDLVHLYNGRPTSERLGVCFVL